MLRTVLIGTLLVVGGALVAGRITSGEAAAFPEAAPTASAPELSLEELYAGHDLVEIQAALEARKQVALEIQRSVLDALASEGLFEERFEPGVGQDDPIHSLPDEDSLGMRVEATPAPGGRLVRRTRIPHGHDPQLEALSVEIGWLMDRAEELGAAPTDEAGGIVRLGG